MVAARNVEWTTDELILLLDLYFRFEPRSLTPEHSEVRSLSELLKASNLPGHASGPKFRNAIGISMKIANLMHLDPDYPGEGLTSHSKRDLQMWQRFCSNRRECISLASAIRACIKDVSSTRRPQDRDGFVDDNLDEVTDGLEGNILLIVHRRYERDGKLVEAKKASVIQATGDLACEVCGFSFKKAYGDIGAGYIECHHTVPLAQFEVRHRTRLEDLAVICANCHRMLHRGPKMLTIRELRAMMANYEPTQTD